MTTAEFIGLAMLVITAVKSVDWIGGHIVTWFKERKARKAAAVKTEAEIENIARLRDVDVSTIKRDDFQVLINAATKIAEDLGKRLEIAESERDEEKRSREKCEHEFKGDIANHEKQIGNLKEDLGRTRGDHKSCHLILDQVQRSLRFLYNTFRIAYWEVDLDGNCVINEIFYNITGLKSDECCGDGWLAAVAARDRSRVAYQWKNFRENFQTHCSLDFSFRHVSTGIETPVSVQCSVVMKNGFEVSYYTARTNPLHRERTV